MYALLFSFAAAATPPSLESPVITGAKARKDAAVLISMEDYQSLPDPPGVRADSAAMKDYFVQTHGVNAERVRQVTDGSRDQIVQTLKAAAAEVKNKGTLWVYYGGYGGVDENGKRILLAKGAEAGNLRADAISLSEVVSIVSLSKAAQVMIVVDASFSGLDRSGERMFENGAAPETLATPASDRVSVWMASTGLEPAPYYPQASHGMFSYLAAGALRGWADGVLDNSPDGKVSLQEAQQYVAKVYRQLGGPDLKTSREPRGGPVTWVLSNGSSLEAGPSKEILAELARELRVERVLKAQAVVRAKADAEWSTLQTAIAAPGADIKNLLSTFVAAWDTTLVTVDGAEVAVVIPQVAEARTKLDALARAPVGKKKARRSRKKTPPPPPPVANPVCQDLVALQAPAVAGQLSAEQKTCLEEKLGTETVQTNKDKISRLLMVDADVRGADEEWLSLVERHLEDFDRSDPDLCLKYALRLSRGGIEDAEEVLRWADVAMENKHVWEGPLYMSRVYTLYRLKAETADRLWHDAEQDFVEDRSETSSAAADKYRGMARNFAREWLDYARSSGQPLDRAYDLCLSASGNAEFCPISG